MTNGTGTNRHAMLNGRPYCQRGRSAASLLRRPVGPMTGRNLSMALKILFVGGTGQISLPCVAQAVAAGHEVSVFNRGATDVALPAGVSSIVGDMKNTNDYAALRRTSWDVVCQFMVFTPEQMAQDIATFSGRTGQYIFISSASVYEKPARHYVITEKTPAINPYWGYSQAKIACEEMVRAAEGLKWTIVRPSHTVRTGLPTMVNEGDIIGHRMLAGKPVLVAGDGTTPWTLTRSADFATPFVGLFGKPAALGEDFHITGDRGFTWNEIYSAIGRGLGVTAEIVHVPTDTLIRYHPDWEGPLTGDKTWTALFDNSKVKRVAGEFSCSEDLDEVLEESIAHFRARREAKGAQGGPLDGLMDRIAQEQTALGQG
jgi:nucleoside-diphosphate-sugar epimerase